MRILIIGSGAVGSFIGARTALAGHDVTLVDRRALVDAVQAGGLTLIEPDGSRRTASVRACEGIAAAFGMVENKQTRFLRETGFVFDGFVFEF